MESKTVIRLDKRILVCIYLRIPDVTVKIIAIIRIYIYKYDIMNIIIQHWEERSEKHGSFIRSAMSNFVNTLQNHSIQQDSNLLAQGKIE